MKKLPALPLFQPSAHKLSWKRGIFFGLILLFLCFFSVDSYAQSKKELKKLENVKQKKVKNSGGRSKSNKGEANVNDENISTRSASAPFRTNKQKSRPSPKSEERQKKINQKLVKKNQPSSAKGLEYQGDSKRLKKTKATEAATFSGSDPIPDKSKGKNTTKATTESDFDATRKNYEPSKRNSQGTQYSGDIKRKKSSPDTEATGFRGNLKASKSSNSPKGSVYEGDIKVKKGRKDRMPEQGTLYSGNQRVKKPVHDQVITQYRGNIAVKNKDIKPKGSIYQGDIKVKSPYFSKRRDMGTLFKGNLKAKAPKHDILMTHYRGNIKVKNQDIKPKGSIYRGDIKVVSGKKKAARYKSLSAKAHQYQGDIKFNTRNKAAYYKKLSTKAHQFQGNFKAAKATKDMHPSANYKNAKHLKTIEQKDKKRKRSIWWFRNNYDSDQPKSVKEKLKSPKRDKKESTIWH